MLEQFIDGDLWRSLDVYGAYRSVKLKESELERKRAEIHTLKTRDRHVTSDWILG